MPPKSWIPGQARNDVKHFSRKNHANFDEAFISTEYLNVQPVQLHLFFTEADQKNFSNEVSV
jgi:hypothetical protein